MGTTGQGILVIESLLLRAECVVDFFHREVAIEGRLSQLLNDGGTRCETSETCRLPYL